MLTRSQCSSANPCSGFGSTDNGCLSNMKKGAVGSNNYQLLDHAADALQRMYQDMPQDVKNDLKISDSYRPLNIQCKIFDFDYHDKTGKKRKKGSGGSVPAAGPGTSNHGWGRALDLSSKTAQNWIKENGYKYGWCWGEVKSEPWHFTFCGPGPNRAKGCDSYCKGPISILPTDTDMKKSTSTEPENYNSTETKPNKPEEISSNNISTNNNNQVKSDKLFSFGSKLNENITEDVLRIQDILKKIIK